MGLKEVNIEIQTYTDCAVKEAAKHFLKTKGNPMELNEPRYLFNESQRQMFLRLYEKGGGKLDDIDVIKIDDDFHEFLCYAVLRTVDLIC